jgi:hypothetical protein
MAGSYEHDKKSSDYIKGNKCLDHQLVKESFTSYSLVS